jgi:hypothetical protein
METDKVFVGSVGHFCRIFCFPTKLASPLRAVANFVGFAKTTHKMKKAPTKTAAQIVGRRQNCEKPLLECIIAVY